MKFHLKEIPPIMFKYPLGGGLNGKGVEGRVHIQRVKQRDSRGNRRGRGGE
jgi:hypothetical protein